MKNTKKKICLIALVTISMNLVQAQFNINLNNTIEFNAINIVINHEEN